MPTPRTRRSSSGVTSATSVQILLLPTSIAARVLSLTTHHLLSSLEGRPISESQVQNVARHRFPAELPLNRLPDGELVVHVLAVTDDDAVARVSHKRQPLLR